MTLLPADPLLAVSPDFLNSPSARIGAWIVGSMVVLGAAWGASVITGTIRRKKRAKQRATSEKTKDLFDEICQAHGLSPDEQKQLRRGVTILDLPSPALMFVDSGLLNKLATSDDDEATEFRKLADRLFPPQPGPTESDLAELTETPVAV